MNDPETPALLAMLHIAAIPVGQALQQASVTDAQVTDVVMAASDQAEGDDKNAKIHSFKEKAAASVRTLLPDDDRFSDDEIHSYVYFHLFTKMGGAKHLKASHADDQA